MSDETRQFERIEQGVDVSINSDSNFYTGFTENISEGGVFIATYQFLPVGSEIEFSMTLKPGIKKVKVRGVVRWLRDVQESRGVSPGMGIEFISLSPEVKERINAFLQKIRDPLFFEV